MLFDLILPIVAGLVFVTLAGYAGWRLDAWVFRRKPISVFMTTAIGCVWLAAVLLMVFHIVGAFDNPPGETFIGTIGVCALLWAAVYTVQKVFLKSQPEDPRVAKRRRRLARKEGWSTSICWFIGQLAAGWKP